MRTTRPCLQAAQHQRHRAVCQQRLQPLLCLQVDRARAVLAQCAVCWNCALYAVKGIQPRVAGRIGDACRGATRLGSSAHARVRLGPAEAGAALCVSCAAFALQTSGNACSMMLIRRSPPAALQKPFRYAACSPLSARRCLLYSCATPNRCCRSAE